MPILNQALAAQGLRGPMPENQQQPAPPQMDPVAMLMAEYERLEPKDSKPMFSPEQANERISRNNGMADVGLLGSLAGDRHVANVGGQVFKQALADRTERRTDRGITDPLSGEEFLSPEHEDTQRETRRGQILQRALAFQTGQDTRSERARIEADKIADRQRHDREMAALRVELKGMGGGDGEGKPPNMVQIKDDATGKIYWANPKTGETKGEVQLPNGGGSLVRADKYDAPDAKAISDTNQARAATKGAYDAVKSHPDSFGPLKGVPDMLGQGVVGSAARYYRDNKSLTPEQVSARAMVYNNVSAVIKDRAGTAQSAQELRRLQGFLPSETDDAPAILAKLKGFNKYLDERETAIKSRYNGQRPMQHNGGATAPTSAAPTGDNGTSGELYFDPTTNTIKPR